MPGKHERVAWQRVKLCANALGELLLTGTGKVSSTDRAVKEGVAIDDHAGRGDGRCSMRTSRRRDESHRPIVVKGDAAWRVAGDVANFPCCCAEREGFFVGDESIGFGQRDRLIDKC